MAIPILSSIFGQKPEIAGFQNVILGDEQLKALLADIKAFPQIEQLGSLWQNYMLGGIERAVPGFGKLLGGITGTTEEELKQAGDFMKGVIPEDVVANTFRSGAMQNLMSGLGGAPIGEANQARNLGLTSLDMVNEGANLLGNASQRWGQLASFGQSTLAPIQEMLITPQQQAAQTESNSLIQRQIQQERNNVAAAPDPVMKGLSDIVMYLTGQYVGSLGGGKMGGGGGGGGLPQAGNAAAVSAEGAGGGVGFDPTMGLSKDSGNPAAATYSAPYSGAFGYGGALPTDPFGGSPSNFGGGGVDWGQSLGGPAWAPNSQLFGTDLYGTTAFSGINGY